MVILSMGGNLGDTAAHFRNALAALAAADFRVKRVSSPYRNPAVGCEDGAPDFINIVLIGEWDGTPEALLAVSSCHSPLFTFQVWVASCSSVLNTL